jgi:hypothetical protein
VPSRTCSHKTHSDRVPIQRDRANILSIPDGIHEETLPGPDVSNRRVMVDSGSYRLHPLK